MQCLGINGSPESGGEACEQLQSASSRTCNSRNEQHLVQAVALCQAGLWSHLPPPSKGNKTQNSTHLHQSKILDHHWKKYKCLLQHTFAFTPCLVQGYTRVLVTTWGHDPTSVFVSNLLLTVNDALTHSSVLIQVTVQV